MQIEQQLRQLKYEIEILSTIDHPNIIKLYDVYEDNKYIHLVFEYCSGGDLFDEIASRGHYSENEAAGLIWKMLLSINHLHSVGICHRDIKPENFLFDSKLSTKELKLIDFGLSSKFGEKNQHFKSVVGTPYYIAPEVIRGNYTKSCDIWSVGVILYLLLSGTLPFPG